MLEHLSINLFITFSPFLAVPPHLQFPTQVPEETISSNPAIGHCNQVGLRTWRAFHPVLICQNLRDLQPTFCAYGAHHMSLSAHQHQLLVRNGMQKGVTSHLCLLFRRPCVKIEVAVEVPGLPASDLSEVVDAAIAHWVVGIKNLAG